jgi:hypothetical protein
VALTTTDRGFAPNLSVQIKDLFTKPTGRYSAVSGRDLASI